MPTQQMAKLGYFKVELELAWLALPGAGSKIPFRKETAVRLSRQVTDRRAERFDSDQISQRRTLLLNTDFWHYRSSWTQIV
jgi:hypothetical protein